MVSMRPICAVLFDADGVVFNHLDDHGAVLWRKTSEEDIGLSESDIGKCFKTGFSDVLTGETETLGYFERVFESEPYKSCRVNAAGFIDYWLSKDSSLNSDTLAIATRVKVPKYMATNQEALRFVCITSASEKIFKTLPQS